MKNISILTAKAKLIEGNNRFINNKTLNREFSPHHNIHEIPQQQKPFAIILGCSDSRVPIEAIFDQGFGDLFIIRIAGNIVAPSQIGSIEFALSLYNSPLVIVLGHSHCGAITATIDKHQGKQIASESIYSITKRITPSVVEFMDKGLSLEDITDMAIKANINNSLNKLRQNSDIVSNKITNNELLVIGAHYDLNTGVVDFL